MSSVLRSYWAIARFSGSADYLSETVEYVLLQEDSPQAIIAEINSMLVEAIGYDEAGEESHEDEGTSEEDSKQESDEADADALLSGYSCTRDVGRYSYEGRVAAAGRVPDDLSTILKELQVEMEDKLTEDDECETPELRDALGKALKGTPPNLDELESVLRQLCKAVSINGDVQLYI